MAEVLGLVITCLDLCEVLVKGYKVAEKHVHWAENVKSELLDLSAKLYGYKAIVERIQVRKTPGKPDAKRLSLLDGAYGPLKNCERAAQKVLESLQTSLDKVSKKSVFGKVFIGSVMSNETKAALKTFDEAMPILVFALAVDERELILEVRQYTRKTTAQVQNIERMVTAAHDEKKRKELGDWLTLHDPTADYESSLAKAFPGAGRWFLDGELDFWIETLAQRQRTMWLRGASGMGKTTLVSLAIDHLKRELGFRRGSRNLVAYFYCSSTMAELQNSETMMRSFIKQLCERHPDHRAWDVVREFREELEDRQNERIGTTSDLLNKTLKKICSLDGRLRVVLVLDAPDESGDWKELVGAVIKCLRCSERLQILVSSTKAVDLFGRHPPAQVDLVDMSVEKVGVDIANFVKHKMDHDHGGLRDLPVDLKEKVQHKIKEGASGSFRWAECQIVAVGEASCRDDVEQALEKMPATLEEHYASILDAIKDRRDRELTRRVLIWLTFSSREMCLHELQEAVCLDPRAKSPEFVCLSKRPWPHKMEKIIHGCGDLVIYDANKKAAKLAHDSVRKYLVTGIRLTPQRFFHVHEFFELATLCFLMLRYLNLPDLSSGHCSPDRLPARLEKWPLLEYISIAFPSILEQHHLWCRGEKGDTVRSLLAEFVASASRTNGGSFGSWVQVATPKAHLSGQRINPIYHAASCGYVYMLRFILSQGTERINEPAGVRGSTPLHIACAQGHTRVVKTLLENGADVNETNARGERGIVFAHRYGYKAIVHLMKKKGAQPFDTAIPVRPGVRMHG